MALKGRYVSKFIMSGINFSQMYSVYTNKRKHKILTSSINISAGSYGCVELIQERIILWNVIGQIANHYSPFCMFRGII